MLYRFLYMPETINRRDLIKEHTEELWISQMPVEEARETRKNLKELDEIMLKGDECTKGEKMLYRFLSFITKIFTQTIQTEKTQKNKTKKHIYITI